MSRTWVCRDLVSFCLKKKKEQDSLLRPDGMKKKLMSPNASHLTKVLNLSGYLEMCLPLGWEALL